MQSQPTPHYPHTEAPLADAARGTLQACEEAGLTQALAESCTGGLVCAALTAIPGSSRVLEVGFITYSNSAKETLLGVAPSLIRLKGAVSEEVAAAMARGALEHSSAGVAVSITGIAGPEGGSPEKPVGLVHFATATEAGETLRRVQLFSGDRDQVRQHAALYALGLVQEILKL